MGIAQKHLSFEHEKFNIEKEFISTKDGLSCKDVYCVVQDQLGFIWFGTKMGLNRYDGKNFKVFTTQDGLASNIVANIFVDEGNHLIIQYGQQWSPHVNSGHTDVLDVVTFAVRPLSDYQEPIRFSSENQWITDFLETEVLYQIKKLFHDDWKGKDVHFSKTARYYYLPHQKDTLVYSDNEGLFYMIENRVIQLLTQSDIFQGDKGRVSYFFRDKQDHVWICTPTGAYKISLKKNYFKTYFTNDQQELEEWPQARGIYAEINEKGEKCIYTNLMAAVLSYSNEVKYRELRPTWGLMVVDDKLYASGYDFYEMDKNSLQIKRTSNFIEINHDLTTCIYKASDSLFYLGSTSSILAFNRFTHSHWVIPKYSQNIPNVGEVYRIVYTSKGVIAVAKNGLFQIDNGLISDYYGPLTKEEDKHLAIQSFLDIHEDKNRCLWIGTNGEGLVKWDWNRTGTERSPIFYTNKDGLSSMVLYRIEEDNAGHLWASTDDGILRFDKSNEQVKVFTTQDGLPHNEFNRTSSFKSEDGWIYFGGINGVVGFNPFDFDSNKNQYEAPFRIIGLTKYAVDQTYSIPIDWTGNQPTIQWFSSDQLLKIDFAVLDYETRKNQFAYRISGVQEDWIYTHDQSISIGGFPYGWHLIEIKVQLADGTWSEQIIQIPIEVNRPFYLRIWFVVILLIALIALVVLVIVYRGQILKKRNLKLEHLITQRTEDLRGALTDKDVLMKELHHRVKNNLQIITGLLELQKEQLKDTSAIAALNEGKMRLESIAIIHQNFYSGTNLEFISFKTFLTDLIKSVKLLFESEHHILDCVVHSEDLNIDINTAIPLGLIVNELLTNSFKYIPLSQQNKKIEITLRTLSEGSFELIYRDNGPGLPTHVNLENSPTLGLRLVSGLSQQIKGTVIYHFHNGSVFTIRFQGKKEKRAI